MKQIGTLILFLVLAVGGGIVIGFLTAPGDWYATLAKPSFNPPAWLFAPVWTLLYLLIAMAGWISFEHDRSGWTMKLWWAQIALNFLWSPVFFVAHRIGVALAVILLLLASILAFIGASWQTNRGASWLFVPYATWVAFAAVLNARLFALN